MKQRIPISKHARWYDAALAKLREESERPGEYQIRRKADGFWLMRRVDTSV
jgi:hypothetical protein